MFNIIRLVYDAPVELTPAKSEKDSPTAPTVSVSRNAVADETTSNGTHGVLAVTNALDSENAIHYALESSQQMVTVTVGWSRLELFLQRHILGVVARFESKFNMKRLAFKNFLPNH